MAKRWVLTQKRRQSIQRASKIHKEMVELGKQAYYRKHVK